jgi:hypothetical protein
LLPSNNLGRSVSLGNASRIRKALTIAAGKLSALREMSARGGSRDRAAVNVLSQFFGNTARYGRSAVPKSNGRCFISQLATVVHTSRYTRTRREHYLFRLSRVIT